MSENNKTTYQDIVNITNCLTHLSSLDLPIWYGISKNLQKCKRVLKDFDELKLEIIKKFADKDKEGNPKREKNEKGGDDYVFKKGKQEEATAILQTLLDDTCEIEFHEIDIAKIENINLKAAQLEPLLDIIIKENPNAGSKSK